MSSTTLPSYTVDSAQPTQPVSGSVTVSGAVTTTPTAWTHVYAKNYTRSGGAGYTYNGNVPCVNGATYEVTVSCSVVFSSTYYRTSYLNAGLGSGSNPTSSANGYMSLQFAGSSTVTPSQYINTTFIVKASSSYKYITIYLNAAGDCTMNSNISARRIA